MEAISVHAFLNQSSGAASVGTSQSLSSWGWDMVRFEGVNGELSFLLSLMGFPPSTWSVYVIVTFQRQIAGRLQMSLYAP